MKEETSHVWIRCWCSLLLLLLCSAAGISGGHGLATLDYGSAVGPAPPDLMRVLEVREKIGLETLDHEHLLANTGNRPLLEKTIPFFFRITENNPSKKRTIIAFIPSNQTSTTSFCLKMIAAIMEKLLYPLSNISNSSSISHRGVSELYDERGVYEVFGIMGCEKEILKHSSNNSSLELLRSWFHLLVSSLELLLSLLRLLVLFLSLGVFTYLNHQSWMKTDLQRTLSMFVLFCYLSVSFMDAYIFLGILIIAPALYIATMGSSKSKVLDPSRRNKLLLRRPVQPMVKDPSNLFINEGVLDFGGSGTGQYREASSGFPLYGNESNHFDHYSGELPLDSNSPNESKKHVWINKYLSNIWSHCKDVWSLSGHPERPHGGFGSAPSMLTRNCSQLFAYLVTIIMIMVAMRYMVRWTTIQTVDNVEPTTSKDSEEFRALTNSSRYLLVNKNSVAQTEGSDNKKLNISKSTEHVDQLRQSPMVGSGGTTHMNLRIAVPVKKGFHEFIEVYHHPKGTSPIVTGFVVDVFKEVMEALPYEVSWEFIPYETGLQENTGYYDDLVYQLSLKRYDGIVGDVTRTANRSKYGDFSLPYMMSGVSMIVPIEEDNDVNSLWWFFKPLTTKMWLITVTIFLLKGILVWLFEKGTNSDFQGTTSEQVGKIFLFSFSIFVFAQKEKLESNFSRFTVTLWMFMVFVIVAVYNANLSLMISNGTPQLTVTNLETLIKNGEYVGYQNGSFVFELLKHWGFQESKLKAYSTEAEYAEALSRGHLNSGVSAIVDEIPYIRVFLTHYGHQYAMGGLSHIISGGFGFVFPKGSKLAHDISNAIVELEELGIMSRIKKRWLEPITCSIPPQSPGTFKKLGPYNFRGLFLITGPSIATGLLVYLIIWIYTSNRDIIKQQWERIKAKASGWYNYWCTMI